MVAKTERFIAMAAALQLERCANLLRSGRTQEALRVAMNGAADVRLDLRLIRKTEKAAAGGSGGTRA